jgi:predicted O-linked N-acetylglucosamine transferase (SPINDLY family)
MANSAGQEQQLIAGWQAIERNDPGAAESIARDFLRQGSAHPQLGLLAYNLLAVSLMQQSRHEEALGPLARVLEHEPRSAGTHLNLGSALTQLGRHAEAIPHFRKAAELEPQLSQAHNNLGHAFREVGRFDESIESYRRALQIAPNDFEVHNNLGAVLAAVGRHGQAVGSYRTALAVNPDYVPALNNLGVALDELDCHAEAIECFQKAVVRDPSYSDAYTNMGIAYQRMKRIDEAVAAHRKAISIAPRIPGAHLNLGLALREQGLIEAAAESFQSAVSLGPDYAEAHAQLGMTYRTLGRHDEAIACLLRALSIKPDYVEALLHLGSACQEHGRLEEAVAHFQKAILLDPDSAKAHHNLGVSLQGLSRHDEAIACFQKALAIDPGHKYTLGALVWSKLGTCHWEGLDSHIEELRNGVRNRQSVTEPLVLIAISQDLEEQRLCAERFIEDRMAGCPLSPWQGTRYRHDRIRVAYLSADFCDHATATLMAELFESHDRMKFETMGVSFGPDDDSEMRSRLERGFDRFMDVRSKGNAEVARLLRELEVDIAVDLKGHTKGARPAILAYRPAPIQVNYLGYPGTMGVTFIDYMLADRFVLPQEDQACYTEKVVYLPDCYQVNDSKRRITERSPTRPDLGLPEKGFVFCCFNNNYKLTPGVFEVWMRLLKGVPGSVLWLLEDNPWAKQNLQREAQARGVESARLVFAPRIKNQEHLARHRLADLFLDTLPCNAHTTTSDALYAGLPVLTCAGTTFAGRVAGSLLRVMGLPELVTSSLGEYETVALKLATEPKRLREIRERTERNRATAPLFDTGRFRRHIESAYTTMWEIWQRGEKPVAFSVDPID